MREFCLTEEVIQQFVDGQLSAEQTETAAAHLAACDDCAQLLDSVEQENEILMQAFAPEMSLTVPTVQLRERIDAAIADLAPRPKVASEPAGARVRNWFATLFGSFSFTPQQAFGFASVAAVVAFAAIFAVIQLRHGNDARTTVAVNPTAQPKVEQSPAPVVKDDAKDTQAAPAPTVKSTVASVNTGSQPAPRRVAPKTTVKAEGGSTTTDVTPATAATASTGTKLLPGEKGYLEAIASLTTAIEANKNDVLKPAVRADYERNLAVVDQAIATTRMQAKRNPKDRDAAEFMYMAYQNKIDLLSAVADQTRIASR